ncbi:uncharacterized protein A1O9_08631 [Exophiala aquamarina CBS 119918]|uniref:C2H2-type domain-containing protein n=1 Tax=Exophiala aquamarina CBS 119918 TaxID=1182545 RepID=A0A072P4F3_9EURO|nr:uncharacterized protein A1O9_08631 [Exophiala aquamarina CBS 119918]KEF54979.1 hypothetical protein A1O9_08631 [Exophiala aquamarina CBS 119918]
MSVAQDQQVQYIDFETDILERSPQLEAVKPDLGPTVDTPPPLVPYESSSDSSEPGEEEKSRSPRSRKRRKGRTRASQGDRVLISYLDHNRPDIALHAGKHPLDSQSESEGETGPEEFDDPPDSTQNHMRIKDRLIHNGPPVVHMQSMVIVEDPSAANGSNDFPMVDPPHHTSAARQVQTPPASTTGLSENLARRQYEAPPGLKVDGSRKKEWDVRPPPPQLDMRKSTCDLTPGEEDSIVKSPALGRYTIQPQDPDAIILPALHNKSPPQCSPAGSPETRQTLPSIRNLTIPPFNDSASMSFAGMSPMLNRPSPHMTETPISYLNSPNPGMSPPEHPSRYSWRSSTLDSSISTSSEYTSGPSVASSTPASSIILAQSPAASYSGPLSTLPEQEPSNPQEEPPPPPEAPSDSADSHLLAGPFRCTFQGCNAIPFQTQYLLSSHMNVHSNTRPHFCPVKGCSRGVGGQGFKRKNEMIRHGLVHTSPGYICPFCADQQHRYPRPDNLQRHVRVHHEDRDRDDPLLRDVLNQRPEGGNRGRRRRMNS